MNLDAARTASLAAPEMSEGTYAITRSLARRLTPPTPPPLIGDLQRLRSKLDPARFAASVRYPSIQARRAMLGPSAESSPRCCACRSVSVRDLARPSRGVGHRPTSVCVGVAGAGMPYLIAIVRSSSTDADPDGTADDR